MQLLSSPKETVADPWMTLVAKQHEGMDCVVYNNWK